MAMRPGELSMRWSKREADLLLEWGGAGADKTDAHLLNSVIAGKRCHPSIKKLGEYEWEPSFREELELRGYDITTLRISVKQKPKEPAH